MNSYTRYYKCPPLSLSLSQTHTHSHTEGQLSFSLFSQLYFLSVTTAWILEHKTQSKPHMFTAFELVYILWLYLMPLYSLVIFFPLSKTADFWPLDSTGILSFSVFAGPRLSVPTLLRLASAISWAHQTPSPLSLCSELRPLLGMFICNISD